MEYIARNIQLKDRIYTYDIERVYKLGELAKNIQIKTGLFRKYRTALKSIKYLKQIIKILTTKKYVFRWHIKHLNVIFEKLGLLKKDKNEILKEKKPLDVINYYITWLSVRLNSPIQTLKEKTTLDEIQKLFDEVLIRDSSQINSMIDSYHTPNKAIKNYFKDITKRLKKLNSKYIKHRHLDMPVKEDNRIAFMTMKQSLDRVFLQ